MKRLLKNVAITCVLAIVLFVSACGGLVEKSEKSVGFIVVAEGGAKTYSVTAEIGTIEDAMAALAEKDNTFTYSGAESEYGLMLDTVAGITADAAAGQYWVVYTSDLRTDENGVPNAAEEYTYEYEGETYYSCNLGVSSYEVADGETILFVVITY